MASDNSGQAADAPEDGDGKRGMTRDAQQTMASLDPITLEVIRHGLVSICNQIDANI